MELKRSFKNKETSFIDKYKNYQFKKFQIKEIPLENFNFKIYEIFYIKGTKENCYFYDYKEKKSYFEALKDPSHFLLVVSDDYNIYYRDKSNFSITNLEISIFSHGGYKELSLFIDPTGNHLIFSVKSEKGYENFYFNMVNCYSKEKELKNFIKLKEEVKITRVAWNKKGTAEDTGDFLILSSENELFSTRLKMKSKFFLNKIISLKGICEEIDEIKLEYYIENVFVIFSCKSKLYIIRGEFNETNPFGFIKPEKFKNFISHQNDYKIKKSIFLSKEMDYFCSLTSQGILHGQLNEKLYIKDEFEYVKFDRVPIDIRMSEYHMYLIYETCPNIVIISIPPSLCNLKREITENDIVLEMNITAALKFVYSNEKILICSDEKLYQIETHQEDHPEENELWSLYFEKALGYKKDIEKRKYEYYFDKSLEMAKKCLVDYEDNMNLIQLEKGKFYLSIGKADLAANLFYQRKDIFSILDFYVKNESTDSLIILLKKLKSQRLLNEKKISHWIIQLYLYEINKKRKSNHELETYILENNDYDVKVVMYLILQFANLKQFEYLCFHKKLFKDYIILKIGQKDYDSAISFMDKELSEPDLYYQFCPILMRNSPSKTFHMLIQKPFLDPIKIIPSLFSCWNTTLTVYQNNYLIWYLEWCLGIESFNFPSNPDPIENSQIVNALILLYSNLEDEKYFEDFLFDKEGHKICSFDLTFAFLCAQRFKKKRVEALILNYNKFYSESVNIALEIEDFQLAKLCAIKSDQKEQLLIKIAQHSQDFMMKLLYHLPLEFILFQDVPSKYILLKTIKSQKKDILKENQKEKESLEKLIQNNEKNKLNFNDVEMKCKSKSCENIRLNVPKEMNNLLVFPCSHVLHVNCVLSFIMSNSSNLIQEKVKELIEKLDTSKGAKLNQIHQELANIAVKECPLCSLSLNPTLPKSQDLLLKFKRKLTTDPMKGIEELTPENFDTFIKDQNVIVQFYHPSSSFCKQFVPHLIQTGKVLLNIQIVKIGKLNCLMYPTFISKYKIDQYPFIILYKKNQFVFYQKELKIHEFIDFAKNYYLQ